MLQKENIIKLRTRIIVDTHRIFNFLKISFYNYELVFLTLNLTYDKKSTQHHTRLFLNFLLCKIYTHTYNVLFILKYTRKKLKNTRIINIKK